MACSHTIDAQARGKRLLVDLPDYLRLLRRSWLVTLVTVLACVSVGVGYTVTETKIYEATAQIFVATSSAGDASQ